MIKKVLKNISKRSVKFQANSCTLFSEPRSSCSQMFFKIGVLENSAIFTGKHLCWSFFFFFKKKDTPIQVLSCEYCEIFKNSFFYRKPLVAASANLPLYFERPVKTISKCFYRFLLLAYKIQRKARFLCSAKKLGFIIFRQHLNSPLKVKGFRTYPVHTYTYLLDTV